jgi:hypothetical protein
MLEGCSGAVQGEWPANKPTQHTCWPATHLLLQLTPSPNQTAADLDCSGCCDHPTSLKVGDHPTYCSFKVWPQAGVHGSTALQHMPAVLQSVVAGPRQLLTVAASGPV